MTDTHGASADPRDIRQFGQDRPRDLTKLRAPLTARLTARVLAGCYDRLLAAGVFPRPHSPLDIHAHRLTTVAEREAVARAFRHTLSEARKPLTAWTARSWVDRPRVVAAEDVIDTVTLWLHSPRPVRSPGMARLRLILADGCGPLYMSGRGNLIAELKAALAAL